MSKKKRSRRGAPSVLESTIFPTRRSRAERSARPAVRQPRQLPVVGTPTVYVPPGQKAVAQMLARAREISQALDEVKPLYNELDQITLALLGARHLLPQHGATITDNFEDKNTQFKTVGIRRFELKWTGGRR